MIPLCQRHADGSHLRKEFNAPDCINLLVSCVDDSRDAEQQTGNTTVHVTILSAPSEMLSLEGEDFHTGGEQEEPRAKKAVWYVAVKVKRDGAGDCKSRVGEREE
ncbi:hypothetical protein PAMP_006202 [Pampus punctatissimus]